MNLNFKEIFAKQLPAVRVRARRDMSIKDASGKMIAVKIGDELNISAEDVSKYDGDDIGVLKTEKELAIVDPSPVRPASLPVPAAWQALPACFTEFHDLSEDLRTAGEHVDLIDSKRQEIFGGRLGRIGNATGKLFMGRLIANSDLRNGNVETMMTEIDMDDPETKQIDRFLSGAEDAAIDYLTRLRDTKSIVLQRLFLECGHSRLETLETLQQLLGELAVTGFAIFQARVAALGLHLDHQRRLFLGSSDSIRFNHPVPATNDLRSAGLDDNRQPMLYVDQPVNNTAAAMLSDIENLATFTPLLAEARKELARASKASLPAGLPA